MSALIDRRRDAPADLVAREPKAAWRMASLLWIGLTVALAGLAYSTAPRGFALATAVTLLGAIAAFFRPTIGIYLIAFFGAMGDAATAPWYPFLKNLSSSESTMFITSSLSVSPAEIYVLVTALAWVLGMAGRRQWRLVRGPVFWPMVCFVGLAVVAAARGLAEGGDFTVAMFELRPLLLLAALFILAINLLETRRQWRIVVWLLMIALTINSFLAIGFLRSLSAADRDALESLVEHSAAVQMNVIFVLVLAAFVYRGTSVWLRALLPVMAVPVIYVYIESQRRAAIVGLVGAALLAAVLLFWNHRKRFWKIMPVIAIVVIAYLGAFWNSQGGAALPAQSVKSAISPEQVSAEDQSSDVYRSLENIDLLVTVRAKPLTGIGFGKPFYRPIALPDISTFVYWEYIPHNSIIAIWVKTGIFGFLSMLAVFGVGLRTGAQALKRTISGDDSAMVFSATAFIIMFAIYAYVDIAWDSRSMIYLALALALVTTAQRAPTSAPEAQDEPATLGDSIEVS